MVLRLAVAWLAARAAAAPPRDEAPRVALPYGELVGTWRDDTDPVVAQYRGASALALGRRRTRARP